MLKRPYKKKEGLSLKVEILRNIVHSPKYVLHNMEQKKIHE